jgi:hypothetical protein
MIAKLSDEEIVRKYPGRAESNREGMIRCITELCPLLDEQKLREVVEAVLKVLKGV